MSPPRLARWLLAALLPVRHRAVVLADLDEEYKRFVLPSQSRTRPWCWYWAQTIRSVPAAMRLRRSSASSAVSGTESALTASPWHRRVPTHLGADVRFGLRLLRRRPGLAVASIATLGAGIAVTTASVSLAHAVLLRGLPYAAPDEIVSIGELDTRRDGSSGNVSWPDFLDYRSQNRTFAALAGHNGGSRTLTGDGFADRLTMAEVTTNFFDTLGVRPALGRAFVAADGDPGAADVVMLTDAAWRSRFGADPGVVGRSVFLNDRATTIIGVLGRDFLFPPRGLAELWFPVRPTDAQRGRRFYHWLDAIGRLGPGLTVEEAQADLRLIAHGFAAVDPKFHPAADVRVRGFAEAVVGNVRPMLLVVLAAALMLMLIACTNIAGLLVARSAARRREIEVRSALGAGRARLARQLVIESLVMAVPAAIVGVVAGQRLLVAFVDTIPAAERATLPHLMTLSLDWAVVAASVGLALGAASVAGLAPAWTLVRGRHGSALRAGVGGTHADRRLQSAFLVAEVAIAVVLLIGAGLMAQSVRRLAGLSPGFETGHLLTMRINATGDRYGSADQAIAFHDDLLARLRHTPGVTGAATINQLPLAGAGNTGTFRTLGATDGIEPTAHVRVVSANYFDVMGVPLLGGRPLADTDRAGTPRVVVVNQTLNNAIFAGGAMGNQISFPFFDGQPYWEVVGVVGDEQFDQIDRAAEPVVYFPFRQDPGNGFSLALRTSGDPRLAFAAVRATAAAIDPSVPLFAVRTMDEIMAASSAVYRRRAVLVLVGVFAIGALLLAAVGIFSAIAQVVTQRTREIGVRLTLGAGTRAVAGSVLRQGMTPAVAGLALGLVLGALFGRALAGLLFEVTPADPATLVGVSALLVGVALAACLAPARRAVRINPVDALRSE